MNVDTPNFTQIPNEFLDRWMPHLGDAELKVVLAVMRLTFGFHRESVRASITTLHEMTGLSRQGVINGGDAAQEHGILERKVDGGVTIWKIVFSDAVLPATKPKPLPETEEGIPTKEKLTKEENNRRYRIAEAIAQVTGINLKLNRGRLMVEAGRLSGESTVTPDKIIKDYSPGGLWYRCFPGVNGSRPQVGQIRSTWGSLTPVKGLAKPQERPTDSLSDINFENVRSEDHAG